MNEAISGRIRRLPHSRGLPLPAYETQGAAGLDVRAAVEQPFSLAPGAITLVPTGFALEVPPGCEMQVRPRSGLAAKHGITLPNSPATIDPLTRTLRFVLLADVSIFIG